MQRAVPVTQHPEVAHMASEKGVATLNSRRHVVGAGSFVDDLRIPDAVYAGFVRSTHAHATIRSIDFSKAYANGAILCISGQDIEDAARPIPSFLYGEGELKLPEWRCLALHEANFMGEPLAAVLAESRYQLEDAMDGVAVDYEPLEPVTDSRASLRPGSALVHDYLGTNLAGKIPLRGGDVSAAFEKADLVIKRTFKMHRHTSAALEPRAIAAQYDVGSGRLTVWASTQLPFILRAHLSKILGIEENKLRVISPDVGGGFGAKLQISPEYVVVCILALRSRRAVKWTESRMENLMSFVHSREQSHDVEAAFTGDGVLLGIKDESIVDAGAYLDTRLGGQALFAIKTMNGPYKVQAIDAKVSIAMTNKCPYGPYRGFGGEAGAFVIERVMNIAAKRLGLSPLEIRRKNVISPSEMPFRTCLGADYDSGDYAEALDKATAMAAVVPPESSTMVKIGSGLSLIVEGTSVNAYTGVVDPGESLASSDFGTAHVRVDSTGTASISIGTASIGTAHDEAAILVASKELRIPPEKISVLEGDTERSPYDSGVRGSRFSTTVLPAVLGAARMLRVKMTLGASHLLHGGVEDVAQGDSRFYRKDDPSVQVSFADVAKLFYSHADLLPDDVEPGLESACTFRPKRRGQNNAYSYSVHVPVVRVDIETGSVRFVRYAVVEDCGNVVSREVADGQVTGGLAQAIGGSLFEELRYDDQGQLLTTSFADYLLPSACEVPAVAIEHTVHPSGVPGGFKGLSESSAICGYAAIANALDDALDSSDSEVNETNLTTEKVWRMFRGRGK